MQTVRVIVAIEPLLYREALAFFLERLRPRAEVSLLSPTDNPSGKAGRAGADPVVAYRMPPAVKEAALWVEVGGGEGLDAERISRGA